MPASIEPARTKAEMMWFACWPEPHCVSTVVPPVRQPLPRESPLYTLDNVILTPHVSGLSRGFWGRAISLFRANLDRDARGLPLWNRVDPARGY